MKGFRFGTSGAFVKALNTTKMNNLKKNNSDQTLKKPCLNNIRI